MDNYIMTDLKSLSDELLLDMSSHGDAYAEEELVRRYQSKVRICSRHFFLLGGNDEDLIQEGTLGLLKAIRTYESASGVQFNTYAEKCIYSRIVDCTRLKSYSEYILSDDVSVPDEADAHSDPEVILIENENFEEFYSDILEALSRYERSVLQLYLSGASFPEIAARLNHTDQSVYNAVQRIRSKLSELEKSRRNQP